MDKSSGNFFFLKKKIYKYSSKETRKIFTNSLNTNFSISSFSRSVFWSKDLIVFFSSSTSFFFFSSELHILDASFRALYLDNKYLRKNSPMFTVILFEIKKRNKLVFSFYF